jgi:hypothetical protein
MRASCARWGCPLTYNPRRLLCVRSMWRPCRCVALPTVRSRAGSASTAHIIWCCAVLRLRARVGCLGMACACIALPTDPHEGV